MAFAGKVLTIVGLLKIELPGRTVRLCDGAFCDFAGERYTARDDVFGAIGSIEPIGEGVGDEAPGGMISFLPATGASPAALSSAGHQNARIRGWLGEIDGKTVTTARPLFDGLVDTTELKVGMKTLALDLTFMARAEKLFALSEGNTLSPRFHQSIWPGELGLDNANGAQISVAWGTDSPPRAVTASSSGGGGYGDGGAARFYDAVFS